MDAVEFITSNLDVYKVLEHYGFTNIASEGDMIRSSCKIHGGNNPTAFVINPESGLWYCHTGQCGGGDIFTLIRKLDDCSFKQAVHRIASILGIDIESLEIQERKEAHLSEIKQWMKIIQSRKVDDVVEYDPQIEKQDVLSFRSFKKSTVDHFGMFFVDEITLQKRDGKDYTLYERLAIPIFYKGTQIGISFRAINEAQYPKWSHQPVRIKTSNTLYNLDSATKNSEIVITEGAFDVWAFHEIGVDAVATFGANLSDMQYRELMKTGADVIVAYDGDDAGRQATKKIVTLFKNKANVSVIDFEDGEDPESISREELRQKYESRRKE